jgi:class 3 adenylate cyclase
MTEIDLAALLDSLDDRVKTELASKPEILDKGHALDISSLPIKTRLWHKATEVVAVFADLKNSSQLGTNLHAASTASVYEAAVGGLVEVYDRLDADYLDIQGDAAFAVFWGDRRFERALCAGITAKTFSEGLVDKWPDQPETGFRVGLAASTILVKRVGTPRNLAQQKPVWAGRAVNYASKAASSCDRHEMVVTGTVWDFIEGNDYLTISCDCSSNQSVLWSDVTIDRLRVGDDAEAAGRLLGSKWCGVHGAEYCGAILAGSTTRPMVESLSKQVKASQLDHAFRQRAREERARRRGLRRVR